MPFDNTKYQLFLSALRSSPHRSDSTNEMAKNLPLWISADLYHLRSPDIHIVHTHSPAGELEMQKNSHRISRVLWECSEWELRNEPPLDLSGLTPMIPFMASLWIRSGYGMKVEMSAETYQVRAHFKAFIKAILVAALKSFERFFRISSSPAGLC